MGRSYGSCNVVDVVVYCISIVLIGMINHNLTFSDYQDYIHDYVSPGLLFTRRGQLFGPKRSHSML